MDSERVNAAFPQTDICITENGNTMARIQFRENGKIDFNYMFKQTLDGGV
jgi:hypothetical protein